MDSELYMDVLKDVKCDRLGLYSCWKPTDYFTSLDFRNRYLDKFENTIQDYMENPDKFVFLFKTAVNGKVRQIVTYRETTEGQMLRALHRLFALVFVTTHKPHPESYAYQKRKDIKSCLKKHLRSDTFLKTDIHSYFDSVSFDLLFTRILQLRLWPRSRSDSLKRVLGTCFYKDHLPIGFVSSPILSDIFLKDLDERMSGLKGICYTRYADDIIISSSGPEAKNIMNHALETLEVEIQEHKLELNSKKTYMRQLKSEGDSIHLLGLNVVKTKTERNRITVSQRFIAETSKEIGYLLQNKTTMDSWEKQRKFTSAMGKVSFIHYVSKASATKLKTLLKIKTGYEGSVTYKDLSKVLFEEPMALHKYEREKQIETYVRIKKIKIFPIAGRCWERVTIPADSQENRIELREYLFSVCREFENNLNPLFINRMELSIGGKHYRFESPYDTKKFRSFIKRIPTEASEVCYSADYRYDNGQPEELIDSGKYYFTTHDSFHPLIAIPAAGTGILYSERENRWLFSRGSQIHSAEFTEILEQSEWEGKISFDLRWPLQIDEELQKEIDGAVGKVTNLLSPWLPETFMLGNSRCFLVKEISIKAEAQVLMDILASLKDLSSLIKQSYGVNKVDAWFVPVGFLETTKETRLKYISAITKKGSFMLRKYEE